MPSRAWVGGVIFKGNIEINEIFEQKLKQVDILIELYRENQIINLTHGMRKSTLQG